MIALMIFYAGGSTAMAAALVAVSADPRSGDEFLEKASFWKVMLFSLLWLPLLAGAIVFPRAVFRG